MDERDLWPLLDELDPDKRLVAVAPRGPLQLPPGGFHWYGVRQVGFPDRETFWTTYEVLNRWLAAFLLALALFHLAAEWTTPRDRAFIGRIVLAVLLMLLAGLGAGLDPLAFCALMTAGLLAQLVLEALTPATGAASVWEPSMVQPADA